MSRVGLAKAATIVIARPKSPHRVFFVKRHAGSAFMANAHVFPGGRLDDADADPRLIARIDPEVVASAAPRMAGVESLNEVAALIACAIRETFEEAGVLLARRGDGSRPVSSDARWRRHRAALNANEASFVDIVLSEDLHLGSDGLVYFDHWITPPGERRRFDTRFFVATAPAEQAAIHDAQETTESCWLSPAEALERHRSGALFLAPPTFCTLQSMDRLGALDRVIRWGAGRAVAPILPTVTQDGGRLVIALPGDPLHSDSDARSPDVAVRRRVCWTGSCWELDAAPEHRYE